MLAELTALILPDWLRDANPSEDELPIGALLRDLVFYPTSHVDGSPVKFLARHRPTALSMQTSATVAGRFQYDGLTDERIAPWGVEAHHVGCLRLIEDANK